MKLIETPTGDLWNPDHIMRICKQQSGWYVIVWSDGTLFDVKPEHLEQIRNAIEA